ncbi:MAG: hypothetical protein ACLTNE_12445 [Intestinimonas butyriciproducens]|uniref:hypothetical protein n=1 Tax=Intestinimonas butyriciproducens TaxID=1297617 RepID=UPI0039916283
MREKTGRPALLLCFLPAGLEVLGMVLLAPADGSVTLDAAVRRGGGRGLPGGDRSPDAPAPGGGLWAERDRI